MKKDWKELWEKVAKLHIQDILAYLKWKKWICLAECLHYITRIPLEELEKAIYESESWKDSMEDILREYWFKVEETELYKKWQVIAIFNWKNNKRNHAIVLNKWEIELNPYAVDLTKREILYFLKVKNE